MRRFCLIAACTLVMMIGVLSVTVQAVSMPPIEDKQTNLTISFVVETHGEKIIISDALISVCKVADVQCNNGAARYTLLPEYSSLQKLRNGVDVTFDGINASESLELAKKLSELVNDTTLTKKTGADGQCKWQDLPHGMYLVREIGKEGVAAQYSTIEPYLISLPLGYDRSNEEPYWEYDVVSLPKSVIEHKSDSDSTTDTINDETDDDSNNTDSTGTDSTGTDSTGTDSTGTDSTGTDSTGTDSTGTDSTGTDSTGTDSTESDSTGTDSTESDTTDTDTTGKETTETDIDSTPPSPSPDPDNTIITYITSYVTSNVEQITGKKVQTGVVRNILLPFIVLMMSLLIAAAMFVWKKKDENNK